MNNSLGGARKTQTSGRAVRPIFRRTPITRRDVVRALVFNADCVGVGTNDANSRGLPNFHAPDAHLLPKMANWRILDIAETVGVERRHGLGWRCDRLHSSAMALTVLLRRTYNKSLDASSGGVF